MALERVKEHARCGICDQVMHNPRVLPCGCAGCVNCIVHRMEGVGIVRNACPMCNCHAFIGDLSPCPALASIASLLHAHNNETTTDLIDETDDHHKYGCFAARPSDHAAHAAGCECKAGCGAEHDAGSGKDQRQHLNANNAPMSDLNAHHQARKEPTDADGAQCANNGHDPEPAAADGKRTIEHEREELSANELRTMLSEIDALIERTKKRRKLSDLSAKQLKDVYASAHGSLPKRRQSSREHLLSALSELDGDVLDSQLSAMEVAPSKAQNKPKFLCANFDGGRQEEDDKLHDGSVPTQTPTYDNQPLQQVSAEAEQEQCEDVVGCPLAERATERARTCSSEHENPMERQRDCDRAQYKHQRDGARCTEQANTMTGEQAAAEQPCHHKEKDEVEHAIMEGVAKQPTTVESNKGIVIMFSSTAFATGESEAQVKQSLRQMGAKIDESDFQLGEYKTNVTHFVTGADKRVLQSRTRRYFAALLRDVTCVSGDWARDCITKGEWLDARPYEVLDKAAYCSARMDPIDTQELRRQRFSGTAGFNRESLFQGVAIVLIGSWTDWERDLARIGGATVYSSKSREIRDLHKSTHYTLVVGLDKTEDSSQLQKACFISKNLRIPVLGVSWLLDSIAEQRTLPSDDPKYLLTDAR